MRGIDMQPGFEEQWWPFMYFATFVLIGALFLMNAIVGAVCDTFNMLFRQASLGLEARGREMGTEAGGAVGRSSRTLLRGP